MSTSMKVFSTVCVLLLGGIGIWALNDNRSLEKQIQMISATATASAAATPECPPAGSQGLADDGKTRIIFLGLTAGNHCVALLQADVPTSGEYCSGNDSIPFEYKVPAGEKYIYYLGGDEYYSITCHEQANGATVEGYSASPPDQAIMDVVKQYCQQTGTSLVLVHKEEEYVAFLCDRITLSP